MSSGLNFDLRGFKGDYEVNVKRNGVTVKVVPFSLTENNTSVHINVDTNVGESDRLFAVDGTL